MDWGDWDNSPLEDSDIIARIEGHEKLISAFGDFPAFRDAEVLAMNFSRGNTLECIETSQWESIVGPSLHVTFWVPSRWNSLEGACEGVLVEMEFAGIHGFIMDGFNYQNPICGLGIGEIFLDRLKEDVFRVSWGGSALRHDVALDCGEIKVVSVTAAQADRV